MDVLFELIRKLVLLVIFAGFCELLLPKSSFRSYTRMVVGLLVMAMLLNPLLQLRGTAWDLEGMLSMNNWPESSPVLQGNPWQQDKTREMVEKQLAEKVREFLVQDYSDYDIQVALDVELDEYGNITDFKGMEVVLQAEAPGIQPVRPVNIGQGSKPGTQTPGKPELINSLARHLGIPAAKLKIWLYTGGGDTDAH